MLTTRSTLTDHDVTDFSNTLAWDTDSTERNYYSCDIAMSAHDLFIGDRDWPPNRNFNDTFYSGSVSLNKKAQEVRHLDLSKTRRRA